MSIILYSGIPGSGKTYKMVKDLFTERHQYYVVHNIDGLADGFLLQGVDFRDYCKKHDIEIVDFFSKEYQQQFTEAVRSKYNLNCLVIIDEANEWFSSHRSTLKMWMSYHRHLNQTVWLVAHRSTNLPAIYRSFIEIEYRAKTSKLICVPGFFIYNRIVAGERVGWKMEPVKSDVFSVYKSQEKGFKKSRPSIFLPFILLLSLAGMIYFFTVPQRVIAKPVNKNKDVNSKEGLLRAGQGNNVNENGWRYVGSVGSDYLLAKDNKISKLSNIDDFLFLGKNDDSIVLFDKVKLKRIVLKY